MRITQKAATARAQAAWRTRRANARKRSQAASKAWQTRRANATA